MSTNKNIHMIGCAGGIGKWMMEKIFDAYAHKSTIYCYDLNKSALEQLPEHIEKCHIKSDGDYSVYQHHFKESDWFILGVPLNHLESALSKVTKFTKENSLFVSLTSTQVDAMDILSRYVAEDSCYMGCHPLFGISLNSPVSQVAILVNYDQQNPQHLELNNCLVDTGLFINTMNAEEHDKNMSVVQALTHFSYLTFAHVVGNSDYEISRLTQTTTPSFQFLLAFASRVLRIAPTTTGTIQATEDAKILRDLFQRSAHYLNEKFSAEMSIESCAAVIEEIRQPFQAKDTSKVAGIAATAVAGQQNLEELYYKYIQSGETFVFRNKLSQNLQLVKLTSMSMDSLFYQSATKSINTENGELFASALDPTAATNYRNQGLNIPFQENLSVLKKNVELVSADFLNEFFENSILPAATQISFINTHTYNKVFLQNWLPLLVKDLKLVEHVESTQQADEAERTTLNLHFSANTSKDEIRNQIASVLEKKIYH